MALTYHLPAATLPRYAAVTPADVDEAARLESEADYLLDAARVFTDRGQKALSAEADAHARRLLARARRLVPCRDARHAFSLAA